MPLRSAKPSFGLLRAPRARDQMADSYYFVRRTQTRFGFGPDLPRGLGFLEMADPGSASPWALYRCDRRRRLGRSMRAVSRELQTLLWSGEAYPPAFALARNDLKRRGRRGPMTLAEFKRSYATFLRRRLRAQATSRHVLAESTVDDVAYRRKGEFCWVLRAPARLIEICWVSSDYFIYECRASEFKLPVNWPRRVPRGRSTR